MGIGADLKKAREEAGITLQRVSDKTKINIPFLEAIEREDWSVFPSQTFAKGFLRAYAKVVKVDTVLATRQFNEEVAPAPVIVAPPFNIESGPIQTAWKFPLPIIKKETPVPTAKDEVPAIASKPFPKLVPEPAPKSAPKPMPVPTTAPVSAPAPPPKAEHRAANPPKPIATSRPPAQTKTVPHKTPKDLALEFDEAEEAKERQAVAQMLFTRNAPSTDYHHWFIGALKVLAVLILLVLAIFGIRGLWKVAFEGHSSTAAEVESAVPPAPTEAPAPMKSARKGLPPIPSNPGSSAEAPVAQKSAVGVHKAVSPKTALPAKVLGGGQPGAAVQGRAVPQLVAQAQTSLAQKQVMAPQTTGVLSAGSAQPTSMPSAFSAKPAALSAAQAAAQAAAPADKYHHLILKGLEASWVSVAADGQARTDLYLLPGQLKTFQAARGFVVKVGNAAGVDAQYDGRSLGVLGGHGRVVDFALPQGYQPSAQH
jgi:transcriptional regulator with XRE-family HTH domain